MVKLDGHGSIRLTFVDMHRLSQMMEDQIAEGHNCCGEPGLVVIVRVTRVDIEAAVERLFREGFFKELLRIFEPARSG